MQATTLKRKLLSPKLRKEIYFTTYLTADEHEIVRELIREWATANGCVMVYYRPLKTGHIPGRRECKIQGNIAAFLKFAKDEYVHVGNYQRAYKELSRFYKAGMINVEQYMKELRKA